MSYPTATYSNGYVDVYKGHRDVSAGWAIYDKSTDKLLASGHSMTRELARRTANSNVADAGYDLVSEPHMLVPTNNYPISLPSVKYFVKTYRKNGLLDDYPVGKHKVRELFKIGQKRAKAANSIRRNKIYDRVRIEIVDLERDN